VSPRRPFVLYVDESIYSKHLVAALRSAGEAVEHVGGVIPFGSKDPDWLELVGVNKWTALTRDKKVRYRFLEKQSIQTYAVGVFTFTGGEATALQTAARIVELLPKIRAIAVSEPRPFLYTFGLASGPARAKLKP
jgi:hypothetical protein